MFLKNPKVEIKGSNLFNFIELKKGLNLEIAFGNHNPGFECKKSLGGKDLTLTNVLIKKPIFELPKFGFFKSYYSLETSKCELFITTENKNDLDTFNKFYNTNYYFNGDKQRQRKDIYGICEIQDPENIKSSWRPLNKISISNSYKEYIDFVYEELVHKNANVSLTLCLQKIQGWNIIPIIDMYFTKQSRGHGDWNEIIKIGDFGPEHVVEGEYPRKYNILKK